MRRIGLQTEIHGLEIEQPRAADGPDVQFNSPGGAGDVLELRDKPRGEHGVSQPVEQDGGQDKQAEKPSPSGGFEAFPAQRPLSAA